MYKPSTYDIRLLCDNCGHEDIYNVPVRRVIEDYDREAVRYSSVHRVNSDSRELMFCRYCKLPYLKVLFWKNDESLIHEGASNA